MDDPDPYFFYETADSVEDNLPKFGDQTVLAKAFKARQQQELITAMRGQKAAWQEDGRGIRGVREVVSNAFNNLSFPVAPMISDRPELTVTTPPLVATAEIPSEGQELPT